MQSRVSTNTTDEVIKALKTKEWRESQLGEMSAWPYALRNLLNILFNSPSPGFIFWGKDNLCFYNELYLKVCGINFTKDDLGEPAHKLFGNKWELIEPFLRRITESGKPLFGDTENLPALMHFSVKYTPFSFVPICGENDRVEGILITYQKNKNEEKIYEKMNDTRDELGFAIAAAELGTWDYDPKNDYLIVNERVCEWFGLDSHHLPLAHAVNCIDEKDRERVNKTITESLLFENGGEYLSEYTIVNPVNGVERRVIAKGKAYFNENKEAYRFRGTVQDITPIIKAVERTEDAEDRLKLALLATGLGMFELYVGKDELIYSPRLAEIFGFPKNAKLKHHDFTALLIDQDVSVVAESLRQSFDSGVYAYEARIKKPNRQIAWIKTRGKVYVNDEGKPHKIIGTVEDITEDTESENKLRQSEHKLRSFIQNAPFPIAIYEGMDMRITIANKAVIDLWGKGDDIIGKTFPEVLPELEGLGFLGQLQQVFRTGIPFEEKNKRVDLNISGQLRIFYFDYIYTPLFDTKGNIYGVMNTATDITRLVTAKMQLEESEARFRLLADSLPQLVWAGDKYGNLDYWNKATYNYCGVSPVQLHEGKWMEIIHRHDRKENLRQWKDSIRTGKHFLCEHRFKTADGTYRWHLSRALPLKDENEEIIRWVGSSTDIEEIKEQEKQKDFFISMASHELKTPVTSIKAYVQVLLKRYQKENDQFLNKSLLSVEKQINKLTGLISELLDLSKIKAGSLSLKFQSFILDGLIEEAVGEILQSNMNHKITFFPEAAGVEIFGDRERIGQVLNNLLSNSIKYSPQKGEITIRSKIVNDEAWITIEDKGIGINKCDQTKIFNRFYRVGGKSEATFPGFGIGLYLVKDIISRHKGSVGVESELGKGSVFYFTLPISRLSE